MTENIFPVASPFKVKVFSKRITRALPNDYVGTATVVGAYHRPYWHPYSYTAYHVIFEDGRKDTVFADHCKGVTK